MHLEIGPIHMDTFIFSVVMQTTGSCEIWIRSKVRAKKLLTLWLLILSSKRGMNDYQDANHQSESGFKWYILKKIEV